MAISHILAHYSRPTIAPWCDAYRVMDDGGAENQKRRKQNFAVAGWLEDDVVVVVGSFTAVSRQVEQV